MSKKIIIALSAVALLIVGGLAGAYFVDNQSDDSVDTTTEQQPQETKTNPESQPEQPAQDGPHQAESRVIDGVEIPQAVFDSIGEKYPDYSIHDADRETENNQVFYEIELEHLEPNNDSEYKLTYDADWKLVDTEFDD